MITLFYTLGVFIFIHEVGILNNTKKHLNRIRLLETLNKESEDGEKKIDVEALKEKDQGIVSFMFFAFFYLTWLMSGVIFAEQWLLFLGLIAFGFSIGFYRRRFYKENTMKSIKIMKFDAFVSSIYVAFIILNHFHHIL